MSGILHVTSVGGESDDPASTRTIAFLHGVLGSGRNWRPFARRFVAACPGWRAMLVDLRFHGGSRHVGREATLDACGRDLARLEEHLGAPFDAVAGHSFGGKVALAWLARSNEPRERTVWVLDTAPGPGSIAGRGRIARVLAAVDRITMPAESRGVVVDALRSEGLPREIAGWMSTNLEPAGDGSYRWRFDLPRILELLDDYRSVDAWPVLEAPSAGTDMTFVRGGRSDVLSAEDVGRLESLARSGALRLHALDDSGHWLHVDDGDGLLRLFSNAFASRSR